MSLAVVLPLNERKSDVNATLWPEPVPAASVKELPPSSPRIVNLLVPAEKVTVNKFVNVLYAVSRTIEIIVVEFIG